MEENVGVPALPKNLPRIGRCRKPGFPARGLRRYPPLQKIPRAERAGRRRLAANPRDETDFSSKTGCPLRSKTFQGRWVGRATYGVNPAIQT
jgi:hypothetical protein